MSYQPPVYRQQPQRGTSCWLAGGIGCMLVIVLAIVAAVIGLNALSKTKAGKEFFTSAMSFDQKKEAARACVPAMVKIHDAAIRYHDQNGEYPKTLDDLASKYLPPGTSLHCDGYDDNPTPTHVTYTYFRPTESTPQTAIMLSLTWATTVPTFHNKMETVTQSETITVGGDQEEPEQIVTPAAH